MQELRDKESVQSWLILQLSERLKIDKSIIDVNERFSRYGLKSAMATKLISDLSNVIKKKLPQTSVWDYPTIELFSNYLISIIGNQPTTTPIKKEEFIKKASESRDHISEPIAVIGIACRFPKANNPDEYWKMLQEGLNAISEVPRDRWELSDYFDDNLSAPGKMNTRYGGFLDHIDKFDAEFFGISPREAILMDPQQRIALQLSWEALENAGIIPSTLIGSRTGVYMGVIWNDYATLLHRSSREKIETAYIEQHYATGSHFSIVPNRISYYLGLQGPSMAIDSACSSSLVTIHLAAQSIRAGESDMALVGGINLITSPDSTVAMSKFGAMAKDGQSKAFDARANGYVRGEGAGLLVLKPLSKALKDGNPIYCIVKGSAVNNDGYSNGLTAPNPQAQREVLTLACSNAGIEPTAVHYVETHGTGTQLGDPIEANALGAILGAERDPSKPLLIGSVKTNIGHLEAAAGVAGVIKAILSIKNKKIPPSLNFESPNPNIQFQEMKMKVQTKLSDWPYESPFIAGVSSFGFGGTNCHVILEEYKTSNNFVLPLAGNSSEELREISTKLLSYLESDVENQISIKDLAYNFSVQLKDGIEKLCFTFHSKAELIKQLSAFLKNSNLPGVAISSEKEKRKLAAYFPGQGSQWLGMGIELMRTEPVFLSKLTQCDNIIKKLEGWSVIDELVSIKQNSNLKDVKLVQPIIFSIQVSLFELWKSWGVVPDVVIGHSMGEVAAAHVAEILNLEDAAKVICYRSKLAKRTSGKGKMAVVELNKMEVEKFLLEYSSTVSVASCNSPNSTVISGESSKVEEIVEKLQLKNIYAALVKVEFASHSSQMDELKKELFELLKDIKPEKNTLPFFSTVTASYLDGRQLGSGYWVRNLRETVQFSQAIELLLNEGYTDFLELSPHPVLAHSVEQSIKFWNKSGAVLQSMRREEERNVLIESAGVLYTHGHKINFSKLFPGEIQNLNLPEELQRLVGGKKEIDETNNSNLLVLSAKSSESLNLQAYSFINYLSKNNIKDFYSMCYTAAVRREHHDHRLTIVGNGTEDFIEKLEGFRNGESLQGLQVGIKEPGKKKLIFVFSGQGPKFWPLNPNLLSSEHVFKRTLERCDEILREYANWSLMEQLIGSGNRMNEIEVIQPVIFSLQVSLAELWRSWGVIPDVVIGHSLGEVAAAYMSGALTLEEALLVVYNRGRLIQTAKGGKMALVDLPKEELEYALRGYEEYVSIAAMNSPRNSVISGDLEKIKEIISHLEGQDVFCRILEAVDFASHSPQMEKIKSQLSNSLIGIKPKLVSIPMVSTVTANYLDGWELDENYWGENLRKPVLFSKGIQLLSQSQNNIFLEVSPHPTLSTSILQSADAMNSKAIVLQSLNREADPCLTIKDSLGKLYSVGYPIDWSKFFSVNGKFCALPSYSWQEERFWFTDFEKLEEKTGNDSQEDSKITYILNLTNEEKIEEVAKLLQKEMAKILKLPNKKVEFNKTFSSMGMDSLMAIELRKKMEEVFGINLPATMVWNYPTIQSLTPFIIEKIDQLPTVQLMEPLIDDSSVKHIHNGSSQKSELISPLAFQQRGIWYLHKLYPNASPFNNYYSIQITEEVNIPILKDSVSKAIERHSILRSVVLNSKGTLVQIVKKHLDIDWFEINLSNLNGYKVREDAIKEIERPFNLEYGPLVKVRIAYEKGITFLLLIVPAILMDQDSLKLLIKEIELVYLAKLENKEYVFELTNSEDYTEYVNLQMQYIESKKGKKTLQYWKTQLSGTLTSFDITYRKPELNTFEFYGKNKFFELTENHLKIINRITKSSKETSQVILTLFIILLYRYTSLEDIIIGMNFSSKLDEKFDTTLGNFENHLPLRFHLEDSMSFDLLLKQVQKVLNDASKNKDFPFSLLVEEINPLRLSNRYPIFQILFEIVEEEDNKDKRKSKQLFKNFPLFSDDTTQQIPYELILKLFIKKEKIEIQLSYNVKLFPEEKINNMVQQFVILLESIPKERENSISSLPFHPETEIKILNEINDSNSKEINFSLVNLFEEQVLNLPGAVALRYNNQSLTFKDLNFKVNQVSRYLISKGMNKKSKIILHLNRNEKYIITLLAVMKLGATCIPIDVNTSENETLEKIKFINPDAIIVEESVHVLLKQTIILNLNSDWNLINEFETNNLDQEINLSEVAFIFLDSRYNTFKHNYFSASNTIDYIIKNSDLFTGSRTIQLTYIESYISIQEIFSSLCSGGTLIIYGNSNTVIDVKLVQFLSEEFIDRIFLSDKEVNELAELSISQNHFPIHLAELIGYGQEFTMNEQILALLENLKRCKLYYHYSIDDCPLIARYQFFEKDYNINKSISFQKPIHNLQFYILNNNEHVPMGNMGTLYIGGKQINLLNTIDSNSEKLKNHPFHKNEKVLKTNMMVKWTSDGKLQPLASVEKIKRIKGELINLKEVEDIINEHPSVKKSKIIVRKNSEELIACILSEYIVPRSFTPISCLIEYNNGKNSQFMMSKDITTSGIGLKGNLNLEIGTQVEISKISLPDFPKHIKISGEIVRFDESIGIKFTNVKPYQLTYLKNSFARLLELGSMKKLKGNHADFEVKLKTPCTVEFEGEREKKYIEQIASNGIVISNISDRWEVGKDLIVILKLPGAFSEIILDCKLKWKSESKKGFLDFKSNSEIENQLNLFFLQFKEKEVLTISKLQAYLKTRLPQFLLPKTIFILDKFPKETEYDDLENSVEENLIFGQSTVRVPITSTEGILLGIWSDVLENKNISINDNFFDIGGTSLLAIKVIHKVKDQFGVYLPISILYSLSTISDMARVISMEKGEKNKDNIVSQEFQYYQSSIFKKTNETSGLSAPIIPNISDNLWFVQFKPRPNASYRLFCFHHAGGSAGDYSSWHEGFDESVEIIVVQLPGRENRYEEQPIVNFSLLIRILIQEISQFSDKPFVLFGHSLGALVAFEVTREMQKNLLKTPKHLILSATLNPEFVNHEFFSQFANPKGAEEFATKLGGLPSSVLNDPTLLDFIRPVLHADLTLISDYKYLKSNPMDIDITVFGGEKDTIAPLDELKLWEHQTSAGFVMKEFPGGHFFLDMNKDKIFNEIKNIFKIIGN